MITVTVINSEYLIFMISPLQVDWRQITQSVWLGSRSKSHN